ncbi:MAG: saccharopine dehydrogenase [Gammaproteobacteria bacterium]|nr:saccharopine dehydrogenase [Gammaproteobacteria bacterium]
MVNKELDMIVFGATSFVGQIICRYLLEEHAEPNFTWAMAARSQDKLEQLRAELGEKSVSIPVVIADSFDDATLMAMCERTEVIISTVGPYAIFGEALVKACANTGTDYCDITGESQWMKRMISRYSDQATSTGARIVHCCGFDSLPSDLGVKFLQEQAWGKFGVYCSEVKMRVKVMKGTFSGGTVASGVNAFKEAAQDPEIRAEMRDWYSLCPRGHNNSARQRAIGMEYDKDFRSWVGPFIMAAVNSRVVLRSNALLQERYGNEFRYNEGSLAGDGDKGRKLAKRMKSDGRLFGLVLAVPLLRWFALKFFLPKPGEGPSLREQQEGFYDLQFFGKTDAGDEIRVRVTGDRDPGYGSTAKMLSQAGVSLLRDVDKNEVPGGFWTPGSIFNDALYQRLSCYAGLSFEVLEGESAKE